MAWFSHGWRAILHYRNLPIGGAFSLFTERAEKYRQKCQKEKCKRNKSWEWFKSKGSKAKEKKTITSTLFSFLFSFALEFQRENLKTTLFSVARLVVHTDWDLGGIVPLIKGRAETFDTLVSFQIVKLHDYHYYFILLFSQILLRFGSQQCSWTFVKNELKRRAVDVALRWIFCRLWRKYGKLKYWSSFINRFPLPRYCYVKEKQSVAACLAANISGRSENSVNWIRPVNRFSFWKADPRKVVFFAWKRYEWVFFSLSIISRKHLILALFSSITMVTIVDYRIFWYFALECSMRLQKRSVLILNDNPTIFSLITKTRTCQHVAYYNLLASFFIILIY